MLFAINAVFKPTPSVHPEDCNGDFNEHLSQNRPRVRLAARMRSEAGTETGVFIILDAADYQAARAFMDASPYQKANLYETCTINALDVEVGTLN